jgi:hypothetical protein
LIQLDGIRAPHSRLPTPECSLDSMTTLLC